MLSIVHIYTRIATIMGTMFDFFETNTKHSMKRDMEKYLFLTALESKSL